MYSKEQVYSATLEYFKGDTLRAGVWVDKYALQKDAVYYELTPKDMFKRLAEEFARIEQKYPNPLAYEEIYNLINDFNLVIPGGSLLYGIGNRYSISSLGNCFVIGNNMDSYGGIFQTDQEQAQLMKRRAGVGHDISHLRPALTPVTNAAGSSTGAVSFLHRYSSTTREVGQNNRRGALMLSMDVKHKDIIDFITVKDDLTKVTGANISVKVDDEFMNSLEQNEYHKKIWNTIIHQAWSVAEPGVLFWDTITRESIPACYGEEWKETSTNPCGEIPLCPYDSCRLLSVNLYSFVEHPFTDKAYFNYNKFKDVVYKAQRLMDDVVDLEEEKINLILQKIENDPEPEEIKLVEKNLWLKIQDKLISGRRTGLSAIGLADCLAALGRTYCDNGNDYISNGDNSESNDADITLSTSITLAEEIYKQFAIAAYKSSIDMGKERGAFPIWHPTLEHDNPYLERLEVRGFPRRNISLLTIPPSGTISLISGISSGIEPVFNLYYKRRYKILENTEEKKQYDFVDQNGDKWREYIVWHPKFTEWYIKASNCEHCPDVAIEALQTSNTDSLQRTIEKSPYYQSTANEINPIQRVKLQATIQKWIDHSISSTINLPESISEADVADIYFNAWRLGCKGITVYREGSRTGVLVNDTKKEETKFKYHDAPKRPKELDAKVHAVKIKGKLYSVIVGLLDNKPYEIFALDYILPSSEGKIFKEEKGKYSFAGVYISEYLTDEQAAITRLVSTSLRHGANIKFIVEQLNKTHGDLTSFSKAIARALKNYIQDNEKSTSKCLECGGEVIYQGGCEVCKDCGSSRCG